MTRRSLPFFSSCCSRSGCLFAQSKAKAQNVPEIPYDTVPNLIKLPPASTWANRWAWPLTRRGISSFTPAARTPGFSSSIRTGIMCAEIGEGNYGFEFAHSVRVDPEDNIWVVDEGTNLVIKFNPAGRVVMVLGSRPPVMEGATATTNVSGGALRKNIFSDGQPMSRGTRRATSSCPMATSTTAWSSTTKTVAFAQVGTEKAGNGQDQFNLPHGIAADAQGNVYVADRSNHRLQVFDNNLKFKASYDNIGDSWTVCVSPGPHQYLFTSNSNPNGNAPGTWDNTGEIYKMELDGTILGRFGHASKQAGGFQVVHMMDCRNPNEIFVAEIEAWRVQKLILKPVAKAEIWGSR